jgi:TonB family protein
MEAPFAAARRRAERSRDQTRHIVRYFTLFVPLAVLFLSPATSAHAQTAIGQVVSLATKRPLGGVKVALVDDSARVVAVAITDSTLGSFFVDAPGPGRYRIALYTSTGASFVSAPMMLDTVAGPQLSFPLAELSDRFAGVRDESQVTRPARLLPNAAPPRYPDAMFRARARGSVAIAVIVDSAGVPQTDSMNVLLSTNPQFTDAVKRALERARFSPAEVDGVRVPQVAQITYGFRFADDPVSQADVVVTMSSVTRRVETRTQVITVPANGVVDRPSAASGRPLPSP